MSSENTMTISTIEGSLIEASKNLHKLKPVGLQQETIKLTAIEEIHDFQTETIHALKILFED